MGATQARKHTIGMAGEFFVTAELLRRGMLASVTYGNAKKADVVALSDDGSRAVVLEVKSTALNGWIIGNKLPEPNDHLWVLVYMPSAECEPPRYFILTAAELHRELSPGDQRYRQRYRERHQKEFSGPGVVTFLRKQALPYEAKWDKITARLKAAN